MVASGGGNEQGSVKGLYCGNDATTHHAILACLAESVGASFASIFASQYHAAGTCGIGNHRFGDCVMPWCFCCLDSLARAIFAHTANTFVTEKIASTVIDGATLFSLTGGMCAELVYCGHHWSCIAYFFVGRWHFVVEVLVSLHSLCCFFCDFDWSSLVRLARAASRIGNTFSNGYFNAGFSCESAMDAITR